MGLVMQDLNALRNRPVDLGPAWVPKLFELSADFQFSRYGTECVGRRE